MGARPDPCGGSEYLEGSGKIEHFYLFENENSDLKSVPYVHVRPQLLPDSQQANPHGGENCTADEIPHGIVGKTAGDRLDQLLAH